MKSLLQVFKIRNDYKMTKFVNYIVYLFRKLPIFKKSTYGFYNTKKVFNFLSIIYLFISTFIMNLIIFLLISLGASLILTIFNISIYDYPLGVFFPIFFFLQLLSFTFKDEMMENYELFGMLNIDGKKLALSTIIFKKIIESIAYFIIFLIFFRKIISLKTIIIFALIMYFTNIIGNAINISLFDNGVLNKNNISKVHTIFAMTSILLSISLSIYLNLDYEKILDFGFLIILLILSAFSLRYLFSFDKYTSFMIKYLDNYEDYYGEVKKKSQKSYRVELKDKDYVVEDYDDSLEGYALLNDLFFKRHRRMISRPIKRKAIILVVIVIGMIGFSIYGKNTNNFIILDILNRLFNYLPSILPFFMYVLLNNEQIISSMFINCDQALLEYGFYSRPKDLLELFILRLKTLIKINSIIGIIAIIGFITSGLIISVDSINLITIIVEIVALTIFFSIHSLFIYYIFQPYTENLEIKSPIYGIIQGFVYASSYLLLVSDIEGYGIGMITSGATIIYIILALILVYKLSPRTFKVRGKR